MTTPLDKFLDGGEYKGKTYAGHNIPSGSEFTFRCLKTNKGYFVNEDDLPDFYRLYFNDMQNGIARFLTERATEIGQLRVDLDFKFEGVVEEHLHTREQVMAFVSAYMAEVKKYLQVPPTAEVYILEKDSPTPDIAKNGKKFSKSGVHIQVPSIKTHAGVEQAIRLNLIDRMEDLFSTLKESLKKDEKKNVWENVYDKQPLTHTNNWTVIGSKKPGDGSLPYRIRYILDWDSETGELSIDEEVPPISVDLLKKMSTRSRKDDETPMTEWGREHVHQPGERRLQPTASSRGRSATREPSGGHGSRGSSPGRIYIQPLTPEFEEYVEAHIDNLKSERYTDYAEWIAVGQCLKNIHPDLNEVWHKFSRKVGSSYNFKETESKWNSFGFRIDGARLGIGSLRHWSALDDFEGFKRVEESNVDALVDKSTETGTENDVAQVIFAKYRDEFKCAKFGANEWYRYTGHIWKPTDRGVGLQIRLSKDIADIYLKKEREQMDNIASVDQCTHAKDPDPTCDCCKYEAKKKAYSNIRLKLKRTGFKESVMKECRELFLDEELGLKLDECKHLIAFNNGVFDTMGSDEQDEDGNYIRPWFRPGRAEDYISFCTNIDYNPEMRHTDYESWPEIERFLVSILPNRKVRDYFLKHLATCLSGGNEAQKFHILTGSGSNGKSMITNLMATAMGDYTCKAPISLLTQSRGKSANAAPELVRMRGRRFVTMQEPDEQVPLNTGLMKELASCEKITARDLYAGSKQMIDFEIQARFHLACNEKPKVNSMDGGTWRRLVVIDFPMKFVPDPKLPNELPVDETIIKKVVSEEWATCFMNYLIHLYKQGNGFHKLVPPEEVMAYTNDYKQESDILARFMEEYCHRHPEGPTDPEAVAPAAVTWNEVATTFQTWKRNEDGRGSTTDLKKRMEAAFGKYPRGGWTCFRFGQN
jgi:P4 family phage/plasmid primase-like protien